jgi:hypothetical protein
LQVLTGNRIGAVPALLDGMKKPSLLLVFLVLLVAANSELPELLHLADNTSNDFRLSTSELRAISDISYRAPVPLVPPEILDQAHLSSYAGPSANVPQFLAETDLLTLYSILRT